MNFKIRLIQLGKKQADLLDPLRAEGFTITPPELSEIINGRRQTPKAEKVLDRVDLILSRWEEKDDGNNVPI